MYFFNSSTGETTWDKPTSPGSTDTDHSRFQSPDPSEPRGGPFEVSTPLVEPTSPRVALLFFSDNVRNGLATFDS